MMTARPNLLAVSLSVALAACAPTYGQNAPATSTPQTKSAAPAAIGPAATGAQAAEASAARNSATRGSRGAAQSNGQGSSRRGGTRRAADNQPGITSVPPDPAARAPQGATAPDATATVSVNGDRDSTSPGLQSGVLAGTPLPRNAYGIARGTPIHVRLQQPVDSGHAKNGQMLGGVLTAPAGSAPAGTPVQLTIVSVVAAGQMKSNGELSVQVVSINGQDVISDVITAEGQEGPKLLPDAAPGRGTEAVLTPDQPLTLPAG